MKRVIFICQLIVTIFYGQSLVLYEETPCGVALTQTCHETAGPVQGYLENGHFFTTFMVAIAANLTPDKAYTLAYYSQLPDEVADYDAFEQVKAYLMDNTELRTRGLHTPEMLLRYAARAEYQREINELLHSLHGGEAVPRRKALKRLVASKGLADWEIGLLIHAFADSFAHSYLKNGTLYAHSWPYGHGANNVTGNSPDLIGNDPQTYKEYVGNLFEALAGIQAPANVLAPLEQFADSLVPTQLRKLGDVVLRKRDDYENGQAKDLAVSQFKYKNVYSPLGGHKIDVNMDKLSITSVRSLNKRISEASK
jgi:ribosome-binding factor A